MSAHNVKNLVFSSSAAVYGMPEYLPIDEQHPLNPINFYGFTKYDMEKYFEWYDRLKGIKYVSLRYFNAVGYDEDGDVRGLEKNRKTCCHRDGNGCRHTRENANFRQRLRHPRRNMHSGLHTRYGPCRGAHCRLGFLSRKQQSEIFNLGTETGISVVGNGE